MKVHQELEVSRVFCESAADSVLVGGEDFSDLQVIILYLNYI